MRALPADQIIDGLNLGSSFDPARAHERRTMGGAVADGKVLVDSLAAYQSNVFQHVPMMIGATSNDIGGKTGYMVAGARNAARLVASKGMATYYYRFSYVAESARTPKTQGAGHASEIPFFFHTEQAKYQGATTTLDRITGENASEYLVNFVKTGNPNGKGQNAKQMPHWPQYDPASDAMMDFTSDGKAVGGPDPLRMDLDKAGVARPRG